MKLAMKLLALLFGILILVNVANAESPRVQFNRTVELLQKTPDDDALRAQIIKLARELKPTPALPDEAVRRMSRGTEAFKEAKSTADYQDAVKEFRQAALAAPWSVNAYFNLGLAQDKAGDFDGSLRSLKLAQLASPNSKDIKDLYYKVEYQRDKAAEQSIIAAKQRAEQEAALQRQKEAESWPLARFKGVWALTVNPNIVFFSVGDVTPTGAKVIRQDQDEEIVAEAGNELQMRDVRGYIVNYTTFILSGENTGHYYFSQTSNGERSPMMDNDGELIRTSR
ncbi:hypothetical protein GALL_198630 [mine drainage metagenome]|uniref:Uncharacterized protein n=1 Tax=mine drainage metagenome TaxID=410659 RepID=A0A1J5S8L3_9ZZZZ